MTEEEILAMKPGKELDVQAAKLLGKPVYKNREGRWLIRTGSRSLDMSPLPYSSDISAAWPIAVKMGLGLFPLNNKDWACCKASYIYHVELGQDHYADPHLVICREAPEAICKAALLTRCEEAGK